MSNRDKDLTYDTDREALRFVLDQIMKQVIPALPGIVRSYDPTSNRAQIQPAVDLMLTDGTSMPRALLNNIPVWWPAAGDWIIRGPLTEGDTVLLVFCGRDISGFKQTGAVGPLPTDRVLAEQDCIAIPGLTPSHATAPVAADAVVIQNKNGTVAVVINDTGIELIGDVTVTGDLTVTGTASGSAPWSPPNP